MVALILGLAVIALGACGGDDDDGDGDASVAELSSSLPAAGDLGLDEGSESEWDDARSLLAGSLVIGGATDPSELSAALEDAGFQGAVGEDLQGQDLNVRIRAIHFDSDEGALDARDLLHAEDLKQPCVDECVVAPREYQLEEIPDAAAAHHVPIRGAPAPGQAKVEAHHAEFVIGPRLYVVQVDGKPSPTFSEDFDKLMQSVHGSAAEAE